MLTLWAGTGQWVAAIIKANAELERMQALMKGVAKGTDSSRTAQANKDLAYTIDLAQKAPFSINAIGDSMVKLRSAGLDATKMMGSLTNAVAAFGGNDDTLKRATIALQQMAGKGVVSMEELRQQLGEAVPTAMALMARGLGVSMAELTKKVSTGTVEATSALVAMTNEMEQEYKGSAIAMMSTGRV
ncbi:tape measure protein [Xanthomonas phage JGB6]|nr:tape measure protein [Xanthomonas phage JGB6]